jgi:hypothetical protein
VRLLVGFGLVHLLAMGGDEGVLTVVVNEWLWIWFGLPRGRP